MFTIESCTTVLGLFLAFPLLILGRQRPANRWLGLFVLSLSMMSMFGLYRTVPQLIGLFDWPLGFIGVFYYMYVRSMVGLGNGAKQLWHFLPGTLWVLALVGLRLAIPVAELHARMLRGDFGYYAPLLPFFQVLTVLYAIAVLFRLAQYRRRVRECYSSFATRDLTWLTWLSCVLLGLLLVWVPANVWHGYWGWALILGRLATLYFVGWYGLRQAPVFLAGWAGTTAPAMAAHDAGQGRNVAAPDPTAGLVETAAEPAAAEQALPAVDEHPAQADAGKYARSGMTPSAEQLIGQRLTRRMTVERDFLEADISLLDVADRIGTSPQLLSQYLNHVLGISFFNYMNGLRVVETQRLMGEPDAAQRTLLDLAYAAGFNNKSTFNNAFKQTTGLTPSHWRSQHGRTSVPIG